MVRCKRCGRHAWFFKLTSSGRCNECDRFVRLELDELELKERISKLAAEEAIQHDSIEQIKLNRDNLHNDIVSKAKKEALAEIADRIESENKKLQRVSAEVAETQYKLADFQDKVVQTERSINLNANKVSKLQTILKSMQYSISRYSQDIFQTEKTINNELIAEAEDLLSTTVKLKFHLMDVHELRKLYNQNNKIIQELLINYQERYTTKANATIYRLMVMALESELQNVLYSLKYSKLEKAIKDIKFITAKYQKLTIDGNQVIAPTIVRFIGEIEYLFIRAIEIEYEYYIQKERMKEEQRSIREQMRQEATELKLLKEERRKVEQEESKYKTEISNIQELIALTTDQIKIQQLEERIVKIQTQLMEVDKKKDEIINLQNGKAGYIYIISNLGSFGENIFKIGMTRRLDPQDRVDELGTASVPFRFDVHSFIFSNSAPELEKNLHRMLHAKRVNKINLRKEFFNTTIDELENLVYSLEPSSEFNRTMLAEQYYQGMAVEVIPESINTDDDENDLDEEAT